MFPSHTNTVFIHSFIHQEKFNWIYLIIIHSYFQSVVNKSKIQFSAFPSLVMGMFLLAKIGFGEIFSIQILFDLLISISLDDKK